MNKGNVTGQIIICNCTSNWKAFFSTWSVTESLICHSSLKVTVVIALQWKLMCQSFVAQNLDLCYWCLFWGFLCFEMRGRSGQKYQWGSWKSDGNLQSMRSIFYFQTSKFSDSSSLPSDSGWQALICVHLWWSQCKVQFSSMIKFKIKLLTSYGNTSCKQTRDFYIRNKTLLHVTDS